MPFISHHISLDPSIMLSNALLLHSGLTRTPQVTLQGWESTCNSLSSARIAEVLTHLEPSLSSLYLSSPRRTIQSENGDLPVGVKRPRPASKKKKDSQPRKRSEPLPVKAPVKNRETQGKDYRKGNSATDQGPLKRENTAKSPVSRLKKKAEDGKGKKPASKSPVNKKKTENKEKSTLKKPKKRVESDSKGMEDMDIFMSLLRTLGEGKKGGKVL